MFQRNIDEFSGFLDALVSMSDMHTENDDGLAFEKNVITSIMEQIEELGSTSEICRKKNGKDSAKYRKQGNEFYFSKSHNTKIHQSAWKLYTQSIALAPNNSEELAMAYGNRSALLFHLHVFKDCIKDCDRGLNITSSDLLKAKLQLRKIECFIALKEQISKNECQNALDSIKQLSLNEEIMSKFIEKLENCLKVINSLKFKNGEKETVCEELPAFEHQQESPCASKSVIIKYEKNWGRHIVATKDIDPGEIIAVEPSYFTFIYPEGMYLHCSNCVKATWALIPCEHCIYDVYCSEKCRSEAWIKYHQFECPVFPYLWDIDKDRKACPSCIRFMLTSVYKAGGINQLRNEFISNEKCEDPRTKGFSSDGILYSNKSKSVYSLTNNRELLNKAIIPTMAQNSCDAVYYLATKTNFFGMKLNTSRMKILLSKDILFIAAVLLRNFYMLPCNYFTFDAYHLDFETNSSLGVSIHPFCSFFNHSCDPNAIYFTSKDNELVVFAKHPIKKGSQIFLSYCCHNFMCQSKAKRQMYLKEVYQFTCKCIACKQNWSPYTLKSNMELLKNKPKLTEEIKLTLQNLTLLKKDPDAKILKYDKDLMKELVNTLKTFAEKATVHSVDYECLLEYVTKMYIKSFGKWFITVPDNC